MLAQRKQTSIKVIVSLLLDSDVIRHGPLRVSRVKVRCR